MQHYVGLDVSLKQTAVCVVDQTGKIKREAMVASDPDAIAQFMAAHAPDAVRIGLESGATLTWLWTELNKRGLPVICIDSRHAKAAPAPKTRAKAVVDGNGVNSLKMQINKSDRNDAAGIARIMQCGWYREVCVKDLDSHAIRALLSSRAARPDEAGSRESNQRAAQDLWAYHRAGKDEHVHRQDQRAD